MIMLAGSVYAGQLFPPDNIGPDVTISCPNHSVLTWTGNSVECTDPSKGVSIEKCGLGELMSGIRQGIAICEKPIATENPWRQWLNTQKNTKYNLTKFPVTVEVSYSAGGPQHALYVLSNWVDVQDGSRTGARVAYVNPNGLSQGSACTYTETGKFDRTFGGQSGIKCPLQLTLDGRDVEFLP